MNTVFEGLNTLSCNKYLKILQQKVVEKEVAKQIKEVERKKEKKKGKASGKII